MTKDVTIQRAHLRDLKPDDENPRAHNPRNIGMIATSLQEVGAGRSIVLDADNRVLAGNGTVEAAAQVGMEEVIIIDVPGDALVAVRRPDMTEEQARRYALYDNRAAELASWDTPMLQRLAERGTDLSRVFNGQELLTLLQQGERAANPFAPNTEPTVATKLVTAEDVAREQARLEQQFQREPEYRAILCPHCAHEFYVDKGNL